MSPTTRRGRAGRIAQGESESRNLTILVAVLLSYAAAGVGLLVVSSRLHGPLRYLVGAVGLVGIGFLALWIGAALLAALGWGFFTATFRAHPSLTQRLVWLLAATLFGAIVGSGTYSVGPVGLLAGPLLCAIVAAVLKAQGFDRVYMNHRLIWFLAIAAAVSIPVGLTIFL
jgi:hypothetical protein